MLTLMQFVTVDSVAIIYGPLVRKNGKYYLAIYFCAIILIVSIALMNLVTAVLVEGALENAQNDKEADKEIEAVPMDVLPKELFEKSGISSMKEIFAILDVDGGGELSQDEFVDGLLDIFFRDVPLEILGHLTVQTLKLLRLMEHRLNTLKEIIVMFQNFQGPQAQHITSPQPVQADQSLQNPSETFRMLLS
eukprot:g28458.t1